MPRAAEIEVLEWPAPKASYSLSARRGKPAIPPVLAQSGHGGTTTGENLVRVGLVADIPDDAIARRVENVMQGDGQFHRPQIGGQVTAGTGDRPHQKVAQLFCYLRQF
jgi:hypothetical protein